VQAAACLKVWSEGVWECYAPQPRPLSPARGDGCHVCFTVQKQSCLSLQFIRDNQCLSVAKKLFEAPFAPPEESRPSAAASTASTTAATAATT
jgi:hypothetical protein